MLYLPWLLALPLTLLLLWLAWRRADRQRLVWRLGATVLASISLVLLLLPPTYKREVNPATAILLTEGFDADTLEALLQRQKPQPQVFSYGLQTQKAALLTNFYTLRQEHPALQTLHLLGHGLDDASLKALQGIRLVPHWPPVPEGVQAVHWPERIKLGETVAVTGKYKRQPGQPTQFYLQADGARQDSIEAQSDSLNSFTLRYIPRQTGRFVYTLLQKSGSSTDTLGQVPVQVEPASSLGVLLLASSPSFEFKFLKNHLAQLQHRVALRTTISKDISQSEWLNMPQTDLRKITPSLLRQFDVVITEPQALQLMPAASRNALAQAVTTDGLGILTIAGAPPSSRSTAFFSDFKFKRLSQQDTRKAQATWANTFSETITAAPYTLENTPSVNTLIEEANSNLLAGAKPAGWGKIAMSFVPQTFQWQLEGKQDVYASYWAALLSGIAKQNVQEKFWQLSAPQVPQPDAQIILALTDYTWANTHPTPAAAITFLADTATSINLPLAQNAGQPEQFTGTFWPRRSGWYQVQTDGVSPYFFFVQSTSHWAFESINQRRQATHTFVTTQRIKPASPSPTYTDVQVPPFLFFVLFVVSSGFLWLEEKL